MWQRAVDLAVRCYESTREFPREESYGLTAQIRRCSVSIAANIAEGYGRESAGNYIQFLKVAQGSLKEFETHALIAERVGFLKKPILNELLGLSEEIGKMLRALIRSLQRSQE